MVVPSLFESLLNSCIKISRTHKPRNNQFIYMHITAMCYNTLKLHRNRNCFTRQKFSILLSLGQMGTKLKQCHAPHCNFNVWGIKFKKAFKRKPTVISGINVLDFDRNHNVRFATSVKSVTKVGFTLSANSWAGTPLYFFRVFWIACD